MSPLFSIITVTYNAESTIGRTLDSVANQSCTLYEHIVMDGASTDNTPRIVSEHPNPRLLLASQPDKGVYDAMNQGLSKANGDYVIFLNSGDTFHSADTLQHFANAICDNDYPGIVYGQTDLVDKDGKYIGPRHLRAPRQLSLNSFRSGMVVCHQAMAVLRRIAPYYNLKYRFSSDYEWGIMCLQHSRSNIYLDEVVVDYLTEGLTTANHKQSLMERFKIMSTYFGLIPTLINHVGFAFRYLLRRPSAPNKQ